MADLRATVIIDYQNVYDTGTGVFGSSSIPGTGFVHPLRYSDELIGIRNQSQLHRLCKKKKKHHYLQKKKAVARTMEWLFTLLFFSAAKTTPELVNILKAFGGYWLTSNNWAITLDDEVTARDLQSKLGVLVK